PKSPSDKLSLGGGGTPAGVLRRRGSVARRRGRRPRVRDAVPRALRARAACDPTWRGGHVRRARRARGRSGRGAGGRVVLRPKPARALRAVPPRRRRRRARLVRITGRVVPGGPV